MSQKHSVTVIDYGIVNLKNIVRGLEKVGGQVKTSSDPHTIFHSDRVVLPGVGAFSAGMSELRLSELDQAIFSFCQTGNPLLGICLGMQLLLDVSEENGKHKGLGIIPGKVEEIPRGSAVDGRVRKVPHIGWNTFSRVQEDADSDAPIPFREFHDEYFYFVHSFMVKPNCASDIVAQSQYEGVSINVAIRRENVVGVQFHPERSGPSGLRMLRKFLES